MPVLTGRVIDQTATLTPAQADALSAKLAAIEKERGAQIVILIVPTARPEDIFSFAQRVATSWKLGRKEVGDGLLLRSRRTTATSTSRSRRRCRARSPTSPPAASSARDPARVQGRRLRRRPERRGRPPRRAHRRREAAGAARRDASRPRGRVGFDWQDMAIFLFVGVPILGRILSSVMGRKLGALAHRRRGRRDRLVPDREPARRRRRRHRRPLHRRRHGPRRLARRRLRRPVIWGGGGWRWRFRRRRIRRRRRRFGSGGGGNFDGGGASGRW